MAQRTVTILSDDLDGKEGKDITTVTFGFDGSTYDIDLSKKNRVALEKALSPYIDAARKVPSAPRRSAKKSTPRVTSDDRAWLRSNGFPDVKDRGRLPSAAIEALRNR
ncbi:Lsr2 family protein [Fodinibacter luteus]